MTDTFKTAAAKYEVLVIEKPGGSYRLTREDCLLSEAIRQARLLLERQAFACKVVRQGASPLDAPEWLDCRCCPPPARRGRRERVTA